MGTLSDSLKAPVTSQHRATESAAWALGLWDHDWFSEYRLQYLAQARNSLKNLTGVGVREIEAHCVGAPAIRVERGAGHKRDALVDRQG